MSMGTLMTYTKRAGAFGIIIFILLCLLEALPLFPNNTLDSFRLVGQQRSVGLRMINNAYIVAYMPPQYRNDATAIIAQDLPGWELEQKSLESSAGGLPPSLQAIIIQSDQSYSNIDTALRAIIAKPSGFNPVETTVLRANEGDYFDIITQGLLLFQQRIIDMSRIFFSIELSLELILLAIWIRLIHVSKKAIAIELSKIKQAEDKKQGQ